MKHKSSKTCVMIVCLAGILAMATGPAASGNDAILDLLVKKGVITQREANDIREQADAEMAKSVDQFNKIKTASWLDSIKLSGDLRLRAEYFDFEKDLKNQQDLNYDRLRFRFRLRVGAELELQDWATVGLRLASGEQGANGGLSTNPNSANQTFTDDFSRKPVGIDLAYIMVHPPRLDWVQVTGGRMQWQVWEPKFASPLVQDLDVNPEGIAEVLQYKFGEKDRFRVFFNAGQYVLNEFKNDNQDTYMFDQELGLEAKIHDRLKLTVAGGYYSTKNLELVGMPTSSSNAGNATRTVKGTGYYLDDFGVYYGRGELAWTISEKPFLGTPSVLTFSGEFLKNSSELADTLEGANTSLDSGATKGWTAQIAFGDNKKKGQWRLAYQYKYLQADSTLDFLTDDDFGSGGTDRAGHVIETTYNIFDWWQLRVCAYATEKLSSRDNSGHNAVGFSGQNLFRAQFDTSFKF